MLPRPSSRQPTLEESAWQTRTLLPRVATPLQGPLAELGAALFTGHRAAVSAERLLARIDRGRLTRRLTAQREMAVLSQRARQEAEALEAQIAWPLPILRGVAGKIRVVIAKPGLDGHDRGAKIIARALRDAGMEVIYTGLHQTPEQIVETAVQEDADAVGISILSGAHMTLVPRILDGLKENGAEDVLVVVGGTIPTEDSEELLRLGVAQVFTPGSHTGEIVDFLKEKVAV